MDYDVLDKLKIATAWNRISIVNQTYVIEFDHGEASYLHGLKTSHLDKTYFLDFEEFDTVPIAFFVTSENQITQYWTINRRLYRPNDKPAKVVYYTERPQYVIRQWYHHGVPHRENGPAMDHLFGYSFLTEENRLIESWNTRRMNWFHQGSRMDYPYPTTAQCGAGFQTRVISPSSPLDGRSHFNSVVIDYSTELSQFKDHPLMIEQIDLGELTMQYQANQIVDQKITLRSLTWNRQNIEAPITVNVLPEDFSMIVPQLNFLGGKLFQNEMTEMVLTDLLTRRPE